MAGARHRVMDSPAGAEQRSIGSVARSTSTLDRPSSASSSSTGSSVCACRVDQDSATISAVGAAEAVGARASRLSGCSVVSLRNRAERAGLCGAGAPRAYATPDQVTVYARYSRELLSRSPSSPSYGATVTSPGVSANSGHALSARSLRTSWVTRRRTGTCCTYNHEAPPGVSARRELYASKADMMSATCRSAAVLSIGKASRSCVVMRAAVVHRRDASPTSAHTVCSPTNVRTRPRALLRPDAVIGIALLRRC